MRWMHGRYDLTSTECNLAKTNHGLEKYHIKRLRESGTNHESRTNQEHWNESGTPLPVENDPPPVENDRDPSSGNAERI